MSYENGSSGPYQRDFISEGERSPREAYNSLQQGEHAEIELELFNRLLKVGIIKASPNIRPAQDKQAMILDNQNAQAYLNGWICAQYLLVLKQTMLNRNMDFNIEDKIMQELKNQSSPQSRLFNWNYICNELEKIGIIIESDIKSLYVAGDSDEVGKLFQRLDKYILRISADKNVLNLDDYRKDERSNEANVVDPLNLTINAGRRGLQSTQKRPVKDGVDIMQMDLRREPSETESTLEFILNTLCRAMNMKPKQAAALLTNNNQFLTHCAVKGVKGRFEPMINWYQELYQYSRHLSMMLEVEIETAQESRDPKVYQAASQNFEKVLQTISCGCYSQNQEVAQLCLKTLACVALDTQGNYEVVKLSMNWFNSKENGIYTINYAMKRHNELASDFVTCVGNFTPGIDDMTQVYLSDLQDLYPEIIDYFSAINQCLPYLTLKFRKEMTQGRLLETLVDRCTSFATQGGNDNPQVKITALGLLCEIWLNFSDYYRESNKLAAIQGSFQRNARDTNKSLRLVAVSCAFKLLDKFSAEKYVAAPSLYKQLIFSLIEAPQEQTVREFYLTNFQYLYENTKQIPVGLLLDPYLKLNQVQDIYEFVTFDYDFFAFIAQHPKLNVQNAIQMLDLLARQYLSDVCRSSVVAVPFMMVCSRFIGTIQCQEFLMKYITISLNQLLQLDQQIDSTSQTSKQSRSNSNRAVKKDFRITSSAKKQTGKYRNQPQLTEEQAVTNRLKKSYIIQMLLKLQNLRQDDVNNAMKDMLLSAQKQYRQQNDQPHKGINAVLKNFGNPESLYNNYLKNQEKIEAEERKQYEKIRRQEQTEKKLLGQGYESDDKAGLRGSKSVKKLPQSSAKKSLALVPITENQQNLRALNELELIKRFRKEKEVDEKIKKETDMRKQTLKQKQLAEELNKRRVELGQLQNVGGVKQELKALIYAPDEAPSKKQLKKFKNPIDEQIKLVDLNEEEDRDRELIKSFMKKYNKIWKYLHSRYQNQIYSIKSNQKDFDQIKQKVQNISLPEVTRMLKDHDCYPKLISKDELAQLIKLTNQNTKGQATHELTTLDFPQFVNFIPQLALLSFSRPPIDKSSFPPIASLQELIKTFEKATRDRGKSTAIYEDPDFSTFKDNELISALEEKLTTDPNYPVPEGYKKVVEKDPIFRYEVPECAKAILPEAQVIATELIDQLLSDKFDFHFLEPLISFEQKIKVKQSFVKQSKPRDPLAYMKKAEKKIEERRQPSASVNAKEKLASDFEIKPKLRLSLKLQVTKHDLKARPHYQDVAEVFEEMLQATENGLTSLPPRQTKNDVKNQVKAQKEAEAKAIEDEKKRKEQERKDRDQQLKNKLQDSNFGDRGMPIAQYKRMQTELDKKQKNEVDQEKVAQKQAYHEKQKAKVEEARQERINQLEKDQEENKEKSKEDAQKRRATNKEFLEKQKTKLQSDFKDQYQKRDDIILREEEIKKKEKENEDRLKKEMSEFIKDSQQDREIEKQERAEITDFLAKQDVAEIFTTYDGALKGLFDFYANQDSAKDKITYNSNLLEETLTFKELVRFGYQSELVPEMISPDDLVKIYKSTVRANEDNQSEASKANMLDYGTFKRALVRLSIVAQDTLGDGEEDTLQKKLDKKSKENEKLLEKSKQQLQKNDERQQKKQTEEAKLREEFEKQQSYKEDQLSKKPIGIEGKTSPRSGSIANKRAEDEKKYQLDIAKLEKEEEFFQKWVKQRNNLGQQSIPGGTQTSGLAGGVGKKKDLAQKELDTLDNKATQADRLAKLKVQKKEIRKKLDVSTISGQTMESLFKYLKLDPNERGADLTRRLTIGSNRRTTVKGQANDAVQSIPEENEEAVN